MDESTRAFVFVIFIDYSYCNARYNLCLLSETRQPPQVYTLLKCFTLGTRSLYQFVER
ncbi:hypothetical protein [Microbulbifer variabilis]|uniref:hypothetical protein n=1 Tax=Microbulbifer variabilis TaxID=266805 RepID=UPI001CFE677D|nr:hypothetical protein [Microbulbifer variabilis]